MFQNREEAGLLLSQRLARYKNHKKTIVLAIPRGGLVVGRKIADILNLPLSAVVVKKLGAPYNPELAIGALAPGGVKVIDKDLILRVGADGQYLKEEIRRKNEVIKERNLLYKLKDSETKIKNKKVILVDDGVATGATVLVAVKYIKGLGSRVWGLGFKKNRSLVASGYTLVPKIILAVPVIAKDSYRKLQSEVDEIVALEIPQYFGAVGEFYREFEQVDDKRVIEILRN